MPAKVDWDDDVLELKTTFANDSVPDTWIVELRRLLYEFKALAPITGFNLDRVGAGTFYDYSFTDGVRTWTQSLDSTNASDPSMTFDVPDYWSLSQFKPQRPLRDWVVIGISNHGLKKIEATFL